MRSRTRRTGSRNDPDRSHLELEALEPRVLLSVSLAGLPDWLDLGSKPILSAGSVSDPGNPASGAVEDIAIDPSNPAHMFAGTVNGGIWRTVNGDRPFNGIDDDGVNGVDDPLEQPSWFPLTDQYPSLAIGDIRFSPLDPTGNTVFAGTGSASSLSNVGGLPIGVMRTTDGGDTWAVFPLNPGGDEPRVRAILPTTYDGNPGVPGVQQVVLVGTATGSMGLLRSTDAGETYAVISGTNGLPSGPVTEIIADPNDSSRYYAGVVGDGVFRSDDGGENWVSVNNAALSTNATLGSSTAVLLAAHPGGGTTRIYAMISYKGLVPQVFTSTDGGASWTELAAVMAGFESGFGDLYASRASDQLIVDPGDQTIVYLAKGYGGSPFILRYNPAGAGSWETIENPGASGNTRPHVDSRDLQFATSGGNDVLIVTNDGGIYFLVDPQDAANHRWTSLHGRGTNGLGVTEYTNVAWDTTFDVATGGAQDNGTSVQNGFLDGLWTSYRGSDGGDVQVDTVNAGVGQVFRYSSTQDFGLQRHTFDSATNQPIAAVGLVPAGGLPGYTNFFVTAYELNAVDPSRLVTGGSGSNPVYELLNAATTPDAASANWYAVPTGAGFGSVNDVRGACFAYGGRLGGVDNPEVLVVGSGDKVFVRSTVGGTLTATPTAFPGGTVEDIVLDPENWQHFFVADASGVWQTTDAGAAWVDLTRNLALVNTRLQTLEFVPTPAGGAVVVGGNLGVSRLVLGDPAAQWARFGEGLPNALVNDLDYDPTDDVLLAGTFGRGAWLMTTTSLVVDNPGILTITGDEDFVNQDDMIQIVRNDLNPLLLDVYLNSIAPVFSTFLSLVQQINVFGLGGDDSLIVDSSFGLITVPTGIRYSGGDGFDSLTLAQNGGDTQTSDTYSVGPALGAGTSVVTGPSGTQTISFTGLEPVLDTVPSATLTVNATPSDNAINYAQGSVAANGLVTIDNLESIEFSSKAALIVNALAGSDEINLNNPTIPTGLTSITVNSGDPTASDTVIVNGTAAQNTIVVDQLTADGARISGAQVVPVTLSGAEHLLINGQGGNDSLTVTTPAGGHVIVLDDGPLADAGSINMRTSGGGGLLPLDFTALGFSGSLTFNDAGGARVDELVFNASDAANTSAIFTVTSGGLISLLSPSSPSPARELVDVLAPSINVLRLHGFADADTFNLPGDHPFAGGVFVHGGDPDSGSDEINFLATGEVWVDLGLATVREPFGPNPAAVVTYTGIEAINVLGGSTNLVVLGTTGDDTVRIRPTGPNEATVSAVGLPVVNGISIGSFGVDTLAGADTVIVEANELDNTIDVSASFVSVGGLKAVALLGEEALTVNGLDGNDVFNVTPGAIPVNILGGPPIGQLQQPSGDLLNLIAGGQPTSLLPGPEPDSGRLTVTGNEPVSFDEIEQIQLDGFPLPINTRVYTLANGQVIIYDSDAILEDGAILTDVLPTHFRIGVDQEDDLRRVHLVGNPTGLGIILNSRDGGPVEFRDARRGPPTNIENLDFLYINGAVTRSYIRSPINGFDLSQIIVDEGLNGGVLDLDGDTLVHDPTAFFSAGPVNSFTIRNAFGDVAGDVVILGADPVGYAVQRFLLQNVTVAAAADVVMPDGGIRNYGHRGGDFDGDLILGGPIASLNMNPGDFAGQMFVDDILRGRFGGPVTGGITFQANMRGTVSFRQGTGSLTFSGDMAGRMLSNGVFGGPARVLGDFLGYFGSGRTPNGPSTLFLTSGQTFNGFVSRIPGGLINVTGEDLLFGGAFAVIDVV